MSSLPKVGDVVKMGNSRFRVIMVDTENQMAKGMLGTVYAVKHPKGKSVYKWPVAAKGYVSGAPRRIPGSKESDIVGESTMTDKFDALLEAISINESYDGPRPATKQEYAKAERDGEGASGRIKGRDLMKVTKGWAYKGFMFYKTKSQFLKVPYKGMSMFKTSSEIDRELGWGESFDSDGNPLEEGFPSVGHMSYDDAAGWVKEYAPDIQRYSKEMGQEIAKAKAKGVNDPEMFQALEIAIKAMMGAHLLLNQANGIAMMLKHGEGGKKRVMMLAKNLQVKHPFIMSHFK